MAPNADANRFLAIYLNDHLAGATLGVELARRLRSSNQGDPEMGEPLARICAEIEADREVLERLTEHLEVERDQIKPVLAKLAERLGRLKLNGQFLGYSPLSRVLELEGLAMGISGKAELWRTLDGLGLGERAGVDFEALAARAEEQRAAVTELHQRAIAAMPLG